MPDDPESCLWCERPAIDHCNAWIGFHELDEVLQAYRCGAAVCNRHRMIGWPRRHHCPFHGSPAASLAPTAKTLDQASAIRRQIQSAASRSRIPMDS